MLDCHYIDGTWHGLDYILFAGNRCWEIAAEGLLKFEGVFILMDLMSIANVKLSEELPEN